MGKGFGAPKTIAQQGGLEAYLDATADKHNGLKYKDLLIRINPKRKHPIPKVVIAEDFGVTKPTIYSWLYIHNQEQIDKLKMKQDIFPDPL